MKRMIVLILCSALLASCATFLRPPEEGEAARIADMINAGRPEALAASCVVPFVVDQELVQLKGDVTAFWKAFADSGLRLTQRPAAPGTGVGADSYKAFADSFELKVYFKKYVPPDARLLTLATQSGKKLLLVVKDEMFGTRFYGIKGPF